MGEGEETLSEERLLLPLPKPHPLLSQDFHQMGRPRHRSSFRREIVGTAGKVTVPPEKRARAAL